MKSAQKKKQSIKWRSRAGKPDRPNHKRCHRPYRKRQMEKKQLSSLTQQTKRGKESRRNTGQGLPGANKESLVVFMLVVRKWWVLRNVIKDGVRGWPVARYDDDSPTSGWM